MCSLSALMAADPAAVLYSENFDTDPGYVVARGPDANNMGSVSYGSPGVGFPNITAGQYGGSGQYLADATSGGKLVFGSNDDPISGKSRSRSCITVVDTSAAQIGQYRVSFDVGDLQVAGANTALLFHLLEGTGAAADKGHVNFQLTAQTDLPKLCPTVPLIKTGKGATTGRVLTDQEISAGGRFSLTFGISEAGKPGDWLGLVWTQTKRDGGAPIPSMSIDNVSVEMLPEPPAITEEIAASPHGQSGDWSLLPDVSDEFSSDGINPRKWNSNPGSWGAWSWDESNAVQESGKLQLRMVHEPHIRNSTRMFYKSGIVRSHHQMTYGYYEARIKGCDLFPGACPAFWIYSDGKKYKGEVRYTEIDFAELQMNEMNRETGERDSVHHIDMNLHLRLADESGKITWHRPGTDPDMCKNAWVAPWDPREDFHIYGCDVTKETITWFIDGEEVAKKPNTYWHEPMNITLSLGLRHPHVGWVGQDMKPVPSAATEEGFPTAMEVDWVRVWERK